MTNRYVVPIEVTPDEAWLDEHGFPVLDRIPSKRELTELLAEPLAIVAGEAWIGKTYASGLLWRELAIEQFNDRLSLEEGDRTPTPVWWSEWRESTKHAWLIIDALDEALHAPNPSVRDVLAPIRGLRAQERARLHVLIFTRDDDSLEQCTEWLAAHHLRANAYRLLPMDCTEAAQALNDPGAFARVLEHLRDPALRSLAKYFPVLRVLSASAPNASRTEFLRAALESLLTEYSGRRPERTAAWKVSVLFEAASRIAAIMLLCNLQTLRLQTGSGQLPVRNAFPNDPDMRAAADHLRYTAVLQRSAAGYRFRQHFAMELFAAFGLRDVAPEAFRLLSRGGSPDLPAHLSGLQSALRAVNPRVLEDALPEATLVERRRTLAWAKQQVDALVDAVGTAPWARTRDDQVLEVLRVNGVARHIQARIVDRTLSDGQREFLFRIAQICDLHSVVAPAIAIASLPDESPSVRTSAIFFAARLDEGTTATALRQLALSPDEHLESRGRARVIEALVNYDLLDPLEAAAIAPVPQEHLYDARSSALNSIEEHLTLEHARRIIDDWNGTTALTNRIDDSVRESLRKRALVVALKSSALLPRDIERLAQLIRAGLLPEGGDELRDQLNSNSALRQALYRELFSADDAWLVSSPLVPDDLGWLVPFATAHRDDRILDDVYRLMRSVPEGDQRATAARELLYGQIPEEGARRDKAWNDAEAERRKWQERRHEPTKPEAVSLANVLRDIESTPRSATEELRALGWVAFCKEQFRPHNVTGAFNELPPETQSATVARVRELLRDATPEPLPAPSERTYSGNLMYEAEAFRAALTFDGKRDWLTSEVATKWLPGVLFALHDDRAAILAETHKSHPTTTRVRVLEAIRRELVSQDYAETARGLPIELWSDELTEDVATLVRSDEGPRTSARAALLRALARRAPGVASVVAREMTQNESAARELRVVAADVLLAVDPEDLAWAEVSGLVADSRDVVKMGCLLHELGAEPATNDKRLPTELLGALAERLVTLFPTSLDGDRLGPRWVGPDDSAREARDRLVAVLIQRAVDSPEADQAVARISALEPSFARWATTVRASAALNMVMEQMAPAADVPPVEEVVRVLDERTHRPVRTEVDLWRVVSEILRDAVQSTIGHDVDLLYDSPRRAERIRGAREPRPNEGKLQAYIRRRLEDLFPRYCDSVSFEPLYVREPQEQYRHRTDLLVLAPLPTGRTGVVAIEIKWSHDGRRDRSLMDQLVKKYLAAERRSYGVYLVGWSGKPGPARWEEMKRLHTRQSGLAASRHAGMRVVAAHLACPWREEKPKSRRGGAARRTTRRRRSRRRSR